MFGSDYLGFIIELMSLLCLKICFHRGAQTNNKKEGQKIYWVNSGVCYKDAQENIIVLPVKVELGLGNQGCEKIAKIYCLLCGNVPHEVTKSGMTESLIDNCRVTEGLYVVNCLSLTTTMVWWWWFSH